MLGREGQRTDGGEGRRTDMSDEAPRVVDRGTGATASVLEGLRGPALLARPAYNRDAAFTERERDLFGLRGLMP
jgi:hypothetical protein